MSGDRGAEIERFFWLILNLLGKAFGFLMAIAGGLFVLSYGMEYWRTDGSMFWNGAELTSWSEQWPLLASGAAVFALGVMLVKVLPVGLDKDQPDR
ncbi:MAG: hypothetical protein HKN70_00335 [Gammaproteobacteria bacterium]|nr:hypothetical protein [Gammaproteobacteria bacterium]